MGINLLEKESDTENDNSAGEEIPEESEIEEENEDEGEKEPLKAEIITLVDRKPSKLESAMAIMKSLILRALVILFLQWFFRRPSAQTII